MNHQNLSVPQTPGFAPNSDVRALDAVVVLSALILVIGFASEVLEAYGVSLDHRALVIGLSWTLSCWALIEGLLMMKRHSWQLLKSLVALLTAQIVLLMVRAGYMVLELSLVPSVQMKMQHTHNNWHFLFMPLYVFVFLGIYKVVVNLFSLQLSKVLDLLNSALHNMSQGICVFDKGGRVEMFNDKACDLLDLPRSLLESKPLLSEVVKFQSDRGDFGPELSRVEESGRSYVATLGVNVDRSIVRRYLRQDRKGRYIEVNIHPMPSGDVVRTYTDVSEYEQVNRQLNVVLDEYQQLSDQSMQRGRDQVVFALTELSVIRDNETGLHTKRTQLFVKTLAQDLAQSGHYKEHLSEQQIDLIVKATPMHDLGKVGIPDHILLKPGRHTEEETTVMRTHAALGESILLVMAGAGHRVDDTLFTVAAKLAGAHHENWDGSGYPRSLSGQDIPLGARLMAVADVYDALTTARVYKRAWTHEEASAHILSLRGTKFDPAIVDAFEREEAKFNTIALELADD
jgi:response regulator RpfG family c-di-GMP phosphodiesterase